MNEVEEKSELIDPDIADLVSVMNESGLIQTIGSCHGHPKRLYDPYVYFSTNSAIAARIESALRIWGRGPNKRLSVGWQLIGHFNAECELRFRLQSPQYRERAKSYLGSFVQFFCKRCQVRQDLKELAELMRQTLPGLVSDKEASE